MGNHFYSNISSSNHLDGPCPSSARLCVALRDAKKLPLTLILAEETQGFGHQDLRGCGNFHATTSHHPLIEMFPEKHHPWIGGYPQIPNHPFINGFSWSFLYPKLGLIGFSLRNIIQLLGYPQFCERWFINWKQLQYNYSSIMSTINHGIQPPIRQLNAILQFPIQYVMDVHLIVFSCSRFRYMYLFRVLYIWFVEKRIKLKILSACTQKAAESEKKTGQSCELLYPQYSLLNSHWLN